MSGAVLDLGFVLLAAFFTFRGCWRGLSGELISLAGTVGGCIVAWRFGPGFGSFLQTNLELSRGVAIVVGLVILFLAIVVSAALIGKMVQAFLRFTRLTVFDRLLGGIAGIIKTGLVLLLFYGGVVVFSPMLPMEWIQDSRAMELASRGWPAVENMLEDTGLLPARKKLPQVPGLGGPVEDGSL